MFVLASYLGLVLISGRGLPAPLQRRAGNWVWFAFCPIWMGPLPAPRELGLVLNSWDRLAEAAGCFPVVRSGKLGLVCILGLESRC